jgi:hypothetical protein
MADDMWAVEFSRNAAPRLKASLPFVDELSPDLAQKLERLRVTESTVPPKPGRGS